MNNFNDILNKLAMSQFDNGVNKAKSSFENITDVNVKKELLLIQQVQLYKDFFAEEQLIAKYRGQVSNLVNSSKAKQLIGYDLAYQHAIGSLKNHIRKYDLAMCSQVKPITFFTNGINFDLKKLHEEQTSQGTLRMSDTLNRHKRTISNAQSILIPQLGRKPTNPELLNFIKNDTSYGKDIDLKQIERVQHYDTRELSGSATIGQENAEGAEALTFEDVTSGTDDINKIIIDDMKEQKVIDAIREFTAAKNERRFLMAYLGIGEFKGGPTKGYSSKSAMQNGLASYYAGDRILDKFRDFCATKGVM